MAETKYTPYLIGLTLTELGERVIPPSLCVPWKPIRREFRLVDDLDRYSNSCLVVCLFDAE